LSFPLRNASLGWLPGQAAARPKRGGQGPIGQAVEQATQKTTWPGPVPPLHRQAGALVACLA